MEQQEYCSASWVEREDSACHPAENAPEEQRKESAPRVRCGLIPASQGASWGTLILGLSSF